MCDIPASQLPLANVYLQMRYEDQAEPPKASIQRTLRLQMSPHQPSVVGKAIKQKPQQSPPHPQTMMPMPSFDVSAATSKKMKMTIEL